ncbi:methylcrotonoyl-CoA carboxylase subunit alpha mitochondrial precursor [Stemphylium lycopersici]|uniref:Methylcrotonoyl-CoA carboxylase subunit alpha mitochondrial n=1 Tax=Stemphylium lycopersici TaxID=183478 RepID=A0A364N9D3_STELY|nr:3-methylcrotonyl-CoA carboxylase subunit alpha [Stemphylium lycopersici]RAR03945.1 methylcrotonoyl-CoA carboxylase subunit alpha mitochondrial precursor [Stemphylium lycopersici]RAR13876.1 methylcrotonoyl-CoA carboxylase subunit alpha mitochondrial precursor [Stemphylium lycopersici]
MRAFRKSTHLSRRLLAANGLRYNSTIAPAPKPLTSVLIANRGEIALRVGRTASEYGIRTTTLYTDPDARSQHALSSPYAVNLGDPSAYLDGDRIIQIAKEQGCQGIHPGYGFLSENPTFARKCTDAGLTFIGPPWQAIESMGSKRQVPSICHVDMLANNSSESKDIMTKAGVPCIPGYHGSNQDPHYLKEQAAAIGYPVLLKAVKGGGGKGMRIVKEETEFFDQLASAKSEARNSFGDEVMLVEKYITTPRHIEVQVFADKHGNCVALGERDCSIQRRHQKILEESPAPHLNEAIRQDIWEKARQAALAVGYEGAGTVEFIFDNETGEFFFMEMNTRLQVEHPVTEMVTGEDLVRWQLIVAEGGKLPLTQQEIEQQIKERGHAIEARIYAENPDMNFIPDSGLLLHLKTPTPSSTVRIDSGFIAGDEVSSHYDPMISKLIVQGPTREAAIQKLRAALEEYEVAGPITNIEFIKRMCVSPDFVAGDVETGYIQKHHAELFTPEAPSPEVYGQAALGLALQEISTSKGDMWTGPPVTAVGFGFNTSYQERSFNLVSTPADGKGEATTTNVTIRQTSPQQFDITVGANTFSNVTSTFSPSTNTLTSFYPHTRLATTFVRDEDRITLFHLGRQHRLKLAMPEWTKKALGVKDVANSVLAPMPCKVLRVEVEEGQEVKKDQALVVIESMKMETVIRSPSHGVVKRIVHGKGDLCKAGTALVEFEEPEVDKAE